MPLGIKLTLLIGENVPTPAPMLLTEALESVEVTHSDSGRSGFQISFQLGRSGSQDRRDYQLLTSPLLKPFNRVILTVTLSATARVLMDGIITNQQFSPNQQLGRSTFTVTGEDVSVMMDLEEKSVEHVEQDQQQIVRKIINSYSKYGLSVEIVPPEQVDKPTRTQRIPVQLSTDLKYIEEIANRFNYVFYITSGPQSRKNTAYWGPPKRKTTIQKALTVNMGSYTNVGSINFQYDALSPTAATGVVQDRKTNQVQKVFEVAQSDRPSLSKNPALTNQSHRRTTIFRETGKLASQAKSRAQAMVNQSVNSVVSATGELDTILYGGILESRGLVGLRGVGYTYDGLYYVKSVTHKISKGEYKQSFTIVREGLGTTKQTLDI